MLFDHETSILSNANTINNNIAVIAAIAVRVRPFVLPEIPAAALTDDSYATAAAAFAAGGALIPCTRKDTWTVEFVAPSCTSVRPSIGQAACPVRNIRGFQVSTYGAVMNTAHPAYKAHGYKAIPLIWPIFIGQNFWHYKWESLHCTACGHRMAHRKWKETKQQPSLLPGPTVPGCSLVSFHFLWAILCPQAVY